MTATNALTMAAISLGLSYLPVAAAPGPNFVIVSRAGMAASPAAALRAAAGVALGAGLLAALAASGSGLLPRDGPLAVATQIAFAALLLRFAVRVLYRAWTGTTEAADTLLDARHFRCGFLTAASNPVTAGFLVTAARGEVDGLAAGAAVFVVAACWFGLIGLAFCNAPLRALYARRRDRAEEILGFVLLAMAVKAFTQVGLHLA